MTFGLWAVVWPDEWRSRLDDVSTRVSSAVDRATADPELRRATSAYQVWYERDGIYPQLSEGEMRERTEFSFNSGIDVSWCSAQHVAITSVTARGTVSRLLLRGDVVGDVAGAHGCPASLGDLRPWSAGPG